MERPASFAWNRWPPSPGIGGPNAWNTQPDYYFGGKRDRLAFKVRYWFLISDIQQACSSELLAELSYFESPEWVPLRFSEPISYPAVVRPRMGRCRGGILRELRESLSPSPDPTALQEIAVVAGIKHQTLWTHETAKHPHKANAIDLSSQIPDETVQDLIRESIAERGFRHLQFTDWDRHAQATTYGLMVFTETPKGVTGRIKTPYGWQNFTAH